MNKYAELSDAQKRYLIGAVLGAAGGGAIGGLTGGKKAALWGALAGGAGVPGLMAAYDALKARRKEADAPDMPGFQEAKEERLGQDTKEQALAKQKIRAEANAEKMLADTKDIRSREALAKAIYIATGKRMSLGNEFDDTVNLDHLKMIMNKMWGVLPYVDTLALVDLMKRTDIARGLRKKYKNDFLKNPQKYRKTLAYIKAATDEMSSKGELDYPVGRGLNAPGFTIPFINKYIQLEKPRSFEESQVGRSAVREAASGDTSVFDILSKLPTTKQLEYSRDPAGGKLGDYFTASGPTPSQKAANPPSAIPSALSALALLAGSGYAGYKSFKESEKEDKKSQYGDLEDLALLES